jgi:hypothetical protein
VCKQDILIHKEAFQGFFSFFAIKFSAASATLQKIFRGKGLLKHLKLFKKYISDLFSY